MKSVFTSAVLLVSFALLGCDSSDPDADVGEFERVVIMPDSVAMEVGEQVDFSFATLTAAGETVPGDELTVRWWSTDTTVFTVDDAGTAIGRGAGKAYCVLEVSDLAKAAMFVGRDSATVLMLK